MVVLITQKVSAALRGELSRWMIEPRTGVFVGQVSAMVRDRLWDMAVKKVGSGGVILLWSSPTEQGFQWRIHGDTKRDLVDFEGLSLVHIPHGVLKGRKRAAKPVDEGATDAADSAIADAPDAGQSADDSYYSEREEGGNRLPAAEF